MKKNNIQKPKYKGIILGIFVFLIVVIFLIFKYNQFFDEHSHLVPDKGGILTESSIGNLKNLSPLAREQSQIDRDIQMLIFEGLLRYDPIQDKVIDGLAYLEVKDLTSYRLTLKNNIYFHDGSPVTMDDILFTYESLLQNPHLANNVLIKAFQYVSINVIDSKTLEFKIIEPNFFFPYLLTIPILPHNQFKNAFIEEITDPLFPFNKKPIGAGPFKLENIVPNNDGSFRVFLERNDDYYGEPAKIDQIVLYVYPTLETLKSIETPTHFYTYLPFQESEIYRESFSEDDPLYTSQSYTLPRFVSVFFNLDRPIMNRPTIRNALSLSFDKKRILEKESGWQELNSFFFLQEDIHTHELDFDRARQLLRDGGAVYNENIGTRINPITNEPLTINIITATNPPVYSRFAHVMQQLWEKELDIQIKLEILSPEDFQKRLVSRDYDMILFGINYSQNVDSLSTWHSSQSGGYNFSNLTNENIDYLINEARSSGSLTDLSVLNIELHKLKPALILATPRYTVLASSEVKNFIETFGSKNREHAHRYAHINEWYFYEKLDWNLPKNRSKLGLFFSWLFSSTKEKSDTQEINPDYEPDAPIEQTP